MTNDTTTITIRISAKRKSKAQKAAAKDGRTLSNWIEQLIHTALEGTEHGK